MKKSKLSLGLVSCLLSVGALAGCDTVIRPSADGVLLSYNGVDIKADAILSDYYDDSSKYQAIYDSIYSIVVRNYFNIDGMQVTYKQYKENQGVYKAFDATKPLGKESLGKIEQKAREKVAIDKDTAETNSENNNTTYKKEWNAILESKGVEDEDELFDKYVDEIKKETFEDDFYSYYIDDLKNGAGATADGTTMGEDVKGFWKGYFDDQLPYHVSHILVKVEDSGSTNYADGTISENNAKKLFNVVEELKNGEDSFGTIASQYSDDEGSAASSGDLGIMDYSTSFVNEFKLGVFAYENFYNNVIHNEANSVVPATSKLNVNTEIANNFKVESEEAYGTLPEISYDTFVELNSYAETTKDADGKAVLEDATLVYPRNIVYNKSLNKHSFAFITSDSSYDYIKLNDQGKELKVVKDDVTTKEIDNTSTTGFYLYPNGKKILSVKVAGTWQPILAVRAGTSDYQGIHFIVINRSAFTVEDANGVNMNDYYTTYYPDQKASYPKNNEGKDLKTYVNFSSNDVKKTKPRATEFASKLKSFDSDRLGKYIFKKFMEVEKIKIKDPKLENALNKWIETSLEKKDEDVAETWKKTWTEYVDTLSRQNSERNKLVPDTCKLIYKKGNSSDTVKSYLTATNAYDAFEAFYLAHKNLVEDSDSDGDIDADDIAKIKIKDVFKVEGGYCNDGKAHL